MSTSQAERIRRRLGLEVEPRAHHRVWSALVWPWDPEGEGSARKPWAEVARPDQLAPEGEWWLWILNTGRGWGKTRSAGEWFFDEGMAGDQDRRMLLAGRTPADVHDYALYGLGGVITQHPEVDDWYNPSKRTITFPTGAVAHIRSGANPEEFRGFSGDRAWLDEFAAWKYPEASWNNLMFGMRENDPRICISTTPKPIKVYTNLLADEDAVVVRGSSYDNRANLSERWVRKVLDTYSGTRLGRQEIEGEVLAEIQGATWTLGEIEAGRIAVPPDVRDTPARILEWLQSRGQELTRIGVGVDPSGGGNEVGIVVFGSGPCAFCAEGDGGGEEHGFVLDDRSDAFSRAAWGEAVVDAYLAWRADVVYGERNYGGDMVENTIVTAPGGESVHFENVSASRGKTVRAIPIGGLYRSGRIHHVGAFPKLEDEMTTFVGSTSDWSPNRMDALVWVPTKFYGLEVRKSKEPTKKTTKLGVYSYG